MLDLKSSFYLFDFLIVRFLSDGLAQNENEPILGKKIDIEVPEILEDAYACCSKKKSRFKI